MLTLADAALDLFVLQLFFKGLLFRFAAAGLRFFGLYVLPVAGGLEEDVLPDCGRVGAGAFGLTFL